jgi:predicted kinase
MKTLIVIVGLPCSGKTHLAFGLLEPNGALLDDISKLGLEALKNSIGAEQIVITDPFLCRESQRKLAEKHLAEIAPDYEVRWVFFENAPEKCLKNVAHRKDGRIVEGFIKQLTKDYCIPIGIKPLEIWQQK